MIRITIELIPATNPKAVKHLGTAFIVNDGTGTKSRGNYKATLLQAGKVRKIWRDGVKVENFPRQQLKVWDLLYRVLRKVVGKNNPD